MSDGIHAGMRNSTTIAVAFGKGGVGKSTLAFHIARAAEQYGPTLAVDLDRQGHLLDYLGVQRSPHMSGLLSGFQPFHVSMLEQPAHTTDLRIIGSDESLAQMDALMVMQGRKPTYLSELLGAIDYGRFKVLDTGTSGYLSEQAIAAADVIVAPVALRAADVEMLPKFLERAKHLNPNAEILVVPNRYDVRTTISARQCDKLIMICLEQGVSRTAAIPETVSFDMERLNGRPVWECNVHPGVADAMQNVLDNVFLFAGAAVPA